MDDEQQEKGDEGKINKLHSSMRGRGREKGRGHGARRDSGKKMPVWFIKVSRTCE